jgi:hypothetical protein
MQFLKVELDRVSEMEEDWAVTERRPVRKLKRLS